MSKPDVTGVPEDLSLGSGFLYLIAYIGQDVPDDATIEVGENMIGLIKGGATLTYDKTIKEVYDDMRICRKVFKIDEKVNFKTGLITFNLKTLKCLISDAVYTEDTTAKIRTIKIGGLGSPAEKQYILRFVHTIDDTHNFRMTMIANNSAGFSLALLPEDPTQVDAEFIATPSDGGSLVELTEEY
jgi:hypothetical protein